MLSTAQQMLQDSRSKIELIRLQIIKVTQAGSGGGGTAGSDGGGNQDSFTHGGQSPQPYPLKGSLDVKKSIFKYSQSVTIFKIILEKYIFFK